MPIFVYLVYEDMRNLTQQFDIQKSIMEMRSFFNLHELVERWRKSEDDILHMLKAGLMPAYCWYEGYVQSLLRKPNKKPFEYKGWVSVYHPVFTELLLGKKASLTFLFPYVPPDEPYKKDTFVPMVQSSDDPDGYKEADTPFPVTLTDLVIMSHDVERMEESAPELTETMDKQEDTPILSSPDIDSTPPAEIFTELPTKEVFKPPTEAIAELPAQKAEKPLIGRQAIADYLGVSVSSVKNYMKDRHFPFHSQGGKRLAYPSELEAWRILKRKK